MYSRSFERSSLLMTTAGTGKANATLSNEEAIIMPTATAYMAAEPSYRTLQRTTPPLAFSVLRVPGRQSLATSGLTPIVTFPESPEYTKGNVVPFRWKLLIEVPCIFVTMKKKGRMVSEKMDKQVNKFE